MAENLMTCRERAWEGGHIGAGSTACRSQQASGVGLLHGSELAFFSGTSVHLRVTHDSFRVTVPSLPLTKIQIHQVGLYSPGGTSLRLK